jgi:hypothetical protein
MFILAAVLFLFAIALAQTKGAGLSEALLVGAIGGGFLVAGFSPKPSEEEESSE